MDHVSERTAVVRARCSLQLGMLAKMSHEFGRVLKRRPILDIDMIMHANAPALFSSCSSLASFPFEMAHRYRERAVHQHLRVAQRCQQCHGDGMNVPRKSGGQAGGSLLAAAIIAGVVGGVMVGQPSIGFLVGTAAGVLIATLLWLHDRRH